MREKVLVKENTHISGFIIRYKLEMKFLIKGISK